MPYCVALSDSRDSVLVGPWYLDDSGNRPPRQERRFHRETVARFALWSVLAARALLSVSA